MESVAQRRTKYSPRPARCEPPECGPRWGTPENADHVRYYPTQTNLANANLKGANLEGANLTRAILSSANLADAMKQEYNPTHIGRVQHMLDELDREIAKLENSRLANADILNSIKREEGVTRKAVQSIGVIGDNLEAADWQTKRRWLYILGVRLYVYHQGMYDDGDGNRWRIEFNGEGLEDLIGDLRTTGVIAGTKPVTGLISTVRHMRLISPV